VNGQATPVKMTIDFKYTQIGGTLTVAGPDHIWQRFTSKRYHYKIAYPYDWDATGTEKDFDYFDSPSDTFIAATRYSARGLALNALVKLAIAYDKTHFHSALDSNVAFTLAGLKARLVTYHATVAGKKVVEYEVFVVKGSYAYDLYWQSPKGHEADDLTKFKEILSTFAFA
jgi:hypothetical protein